MFLRTKWLVLAKYSLKFLNYYKWLINVSYYFYFVYKFRCVPEIIKGVLYTFKKYPQKIPPQKNHYIPVHSDEHWHRSEILVRLGQFLLLCKTIPKSHWLAMTKFNLWVALPTYVSSAGAGLPITSGTFLFDEHRVWTVAGKGEREPWGITQWLLQFRLESNTNPFLLYFAC